MLIGASGRCVCVSVLMMMVMMLMVPDIYTFNIHWKILNLSIIISDLVDLPENHFLIAH